MSTRLTQQSVPVENLLIRASFSSKKLLVIYAVYDNQNIVYAFGTRPTNWYDMGRGTWMVSHFFWAAWDVLLSRMLSTLFDFKLPFLTCSAFCPCFRVQIMATCLCKKKIPEYPSLFSFSQRTVIRKIPICCHAFYSDRMNTSGAFNSSKDMV